MRIALLALGMTMIAGGASAQVGYPGRPYGGDPLADQHRYRLETQRQQSAEQAAFARQSQLNARLTELEIRNQRQPAPYVPLVDTLPSPRSPEAQARAEDQARRRGEAVAAGIGQIDDWLSRGPR